MATSEPAPHTVNVAQRRHESKKGEFKTCSSKAAVLIIRSLRRGVLQEPEPGVYLYSTFIYMYIYIYIYIYIRSLIYI
jgi:uncharacterized MAPEG superfamily protein